jgi:hypothetical protein
MMVTLEELNRKYVIYPDGYIINKETNKRVSFCDDGRGYMKARLYSPLSLNKDGRKPYRLHRLIAKAFLVDYRDDLQVNHKNVIKNDNRVENLEMVTASEIVYHSWNNLDSYERKQKLNKRRNEQGRFE